MSKDNVQVTDKRIKDIINYMIQEEFIGGKVRGEVEENIERIDKELKMISSEEELKMDYSELTKKLLAHYNRDDADFKTKILLFKSKDSVSSLRGYKEIYFNEIVQNANDILPEDIPLEDCRMEVYVRKENEKYEMKFKYADNGFSVKNLVGFLDMEMPTKRKDLSTTGKHGVGIKSLYTFVDHIKIESNIKIEIKFGYDENESAKVEIDVEKNKDYNWKKPYTYLFLSFEKEPRYLENVEEDVRFHTQKLFDFIDACVDEEKYNDLSGYFFGLAAKETIFDIRSLIFTDKNKNKKNGIKKLSFFKNNFDAENRVFDIRCNEKYAENKKSYDDRNKKYSHATLIYKDKKTEKIQEYLVFTIEYKENEDKERQNFTVAFPCAEELKNNSKERYYNTYYLSEADASEYEMNILINSDESNTVRTKLADNEEKIEKIKTEICNTLIEVYEFMVSKELSENTEYQEEISKLFHKLIYFNPKALANYYADEEEKNNLRLVDIFFQNNINNRYLKKLKEEHNDDAYIVYKREDIEEYEKRRIGKSEITLDELKNFVEERYINGRKIEGKYIYDTIKYDKELFIDDFYIKELYENHLNDTNSIIKSILNIAGSIKELIYYRIMGNFPYDEVDIRNSEMIDRLSGEIYKEYGNSKKHVDMFLMILGRYKLNRNISINGDIKSASFHRFLFNGIDERKTRIYPEYRTFKEIDDGAFNDSENKALKERLNDVLINKERKNAEAVFLSKDRIIERIEYDVGEVVFRISSRRSCYIYYNGLDLRREFFKDSDDFDKDKTIEFLQKIKTDQSLFNNIVVFGSVSSLPEIAIISDAEFLIGKTPEHRYVGAPHTFRHSTEAYKVCKMLNISFIKKLYAHNWEDFLFYTDFIRDTKIAKGNLSELCGVYTEKEEKPLFNISPDDMKDMAKYLYRYYDTDSKIINRELIDNKTKLIVGFEGQPSKNLCPVELFQFIKDMTDINVWVMQTVAVNGKKNEIIYWYKNEFCMRDSNSFKSIGISRGNASKDLVIVHNGRNDMKEVINLVLKEILTGDGDICEKVASFIPNNRLAKIEYSEIWDRNWEGNKESQKIEMENIAEKDRIPCSELIKLITARGNNDNSCCCCGKKIYGKEQNLIITKNSNGSTQSDYPKVYEVVCGSCKDILIKRHTSTEIIEEEEKYYVKYKCKISNSRQNKPVVFTHRLCDGVRGICYR